MRRLSMRVAAALILVLAVGSSVETATASQRSGHPAWHPRSPRTGAAGERVWGYAAHFHVPGSSQAWWLDVTHDGLGSHLVIAEDNPNWGVSGVEQGHSWSFDLPDGAIGATKDLGRGYIRTGSALGVFGSVDFAFVPNKPTARVRDVCQTGTLLGTSRSRRGMLVGDLSFAANEGSLPPPFSVASAKAWITTTTYTGASCPTVKSCARPGGFVMFHQGTSVLMTGVNRRGTGWQLRAGITEVSGPATISHWMYAFADGERPPTVVTDPGGGVVIDASIVAPDFSGSLTFAPTTSSVRPTYCGSVERTDLMWIAGALTVNFDSGPAVFTGSALAGREVQFLH